MARPLDFKSCQPTSVDLSFLVCVSVQYGRSQRDRMSARNAVVGEKRSGEWNSGFDQCTRLTEGNLAGEPLGSATKTRKSGQSRHLSTPTSEYYCDSGHASASPSDASQSTYVDTICKIVEDWPGLEKAIIISEGEKLREERHRGKSVDTIRSGFQNVFSVQSKKKNPRIQGWNYGPTDAKGKLTPGNTRCRWLLAGVDPGRIQLWEAPRIPLAPSNQATAQDTRHGIQFFPREAAKEWVSGPVGLPTAIEGRVDMQDSNSCTGIGNGTPALPRHENDEVADDQMASSNRAVGQHESADLGAYDDWSERAQGDYWGVEVRRKKTLLKKTRDAKELVRGLSCRSAQLKESADRDTSQLSDLENQARILRENIEKQAKESETIRGEEAIASKAASDLEKQVREIDKKLEQYWAEDD